MIDHESVAAGAEIFPESQGAVSLTAVGAVGSVFSRPAASGAGFLCSLRPVGGDSNYGEYKCDNPVFRRGRRNPSAVRAI